MEVKLNDLPKIRATRFRHSNSIRWLQHAGFLTFDRATVGLRPAWRVINQMGYEPVTLIGWNALVGNTLMIGREGQIAVLADVGGEVMWQHCPCFPEEREATVFIIEDP